MSNYYASQVASVLEDFVNDTVSSAIDYDELAREVSGYIDTDEIASEVTDRIDSVQVVENATYGTRVEDWFECSHFVKEDDLDDRIAEYIGKDFTLNDLVTLQRKVERIERLFAHLPGAFRHLANVAEQVTRDVDDPFSPAYVGGTD